MTVPTSIDQAIRYAAKEQEIDLAILRSIIEQESGFNPYELRFEPLWKYMLTPVTFAEKLGITVDTEMATQKMSWGLGQLMGSVARELGFMGHMGSFLLPETNVDYICKYLKKIMIKAKTPEDIFAYYNGGPGALFAKQRDGHFSDEVQRYVDSCMQHLSHWRTES